jgi:hypothetical protein
VHNLGLSGCFTRQPEVLMHIAYVLKMVLVSAALGEH